MNQENQIKTISVSGGFHNVSARVFRVKNNTISYDQYKNMVKHLCSVAECKCGSFRENTQCVDQNGKKVYFDDEDIMDYEYLENNPNYYDQRIIKRIRVTNVKEW